MKHKLLKMPHILLRLEGTAVFLAVLILYWQFGFNWWQFALMLLLPDLAMLAYLSGEAVGSLVYNLVHTYILPIILGILALLLGWSVGLQLALIWLAHIGLDRLFGYGLKYPTNFKETHFSKL